MKIGYVIAVDGPAGAGKSTVARELARKLNYRYIDTGAMYRAAALAASREGVELSEGPELMDFLNRLTITQDMDGDRVLTRLGDEDVSERIRSQEMAMKASAISALPAVRRRLLDLQREMGEAGGVVMEGRDIGTVVFPDADYKFFLTASDEERARRRLLEIHDKGADADFETVLKELRDRDRRDSTRKVAPLCRARDAQMIDSDRKDVDEVVEEILGFIERGRRGRE